MKKDIGQEIDYPLQLIKQLTPYLDTMTYKANHITKGTYDKHISLKLRGFAWYYVYNGGNKTDAFRRAYYSTLDKETGKLLCKKEISQNTIAAGGYRTYRMPQIQTCISLIRQDIEHKIKTDVPQSILEQLQIRATYDPSMFINPDGSPVFKTWDEIPLAYRCCVEGIETKHYGKDGTETATVIKLTDRTKAMKELMALAPDLLKADELTVIHKTIDSTGKEKGIDVRNYSDEQLIAFLAKNKG